MTFLLFVAFFLVVDIYLFQAVLAVSQDWSPFWKKVLRYGFWVPTVLCIAALSWWMFADPYRISSGMRNWILTGLFATYFSKTLGILFVFADDIQRGVRWVAGVFGSGSPTDSGLFLP